MTYKCKMCCDTGKIAIGEAGFDYCPAPFCAARSRVYWAKVHAAATHETDKELWLEANHRAPAFTLAPGVMLTPEERERAYDMIAATEEQDRRDRYAD